MGHWLSTSQPVLKLVGPLSIMWSRLETRSNGLKAGQTAWKLAEWFKSNLNGMKASQWSIQVRQSRKQDPTNASTDHILKLILAGVGWVSPVRLRSKAKTNIKTKCLASVPDCFAASLSSSFYQHILKDRQYLISAAHAWVHFLTTHASLLTRFLTLRKLDQF